MTIENFLGVIAFLFTLPHRALPESITKKIQRELCGQEFTRYLFKFLVKHCVLALTVPRKGHSHVFVW